jgi:hypothetical protein
VTYLSIGNFIWNKKKYTYGGQNGENKPLEPKTSKINFRTKKVKIEQAFPKIHAKKVFVGLKSKKTS